MKDETLATRLGTTAHISPLLMKARRLGLCAAEDFERLAVRRGLSYYDCLPESVVLREEAEGYDPALSDEELAVALASPSFRYSQLRLRMSAAILAAEDNSPEVLARLARQERCEAVFVHVARCGARVEPGNEFWTMLLEALPQLPEAPPDLLPHITRFVAMTGFTRRGKETVMQWIRPSRTLPV